MKKPAQPHIGNTHQTVMEINTGRSVQSIRIGFTDQRLTAYGGMAFWSAFLHKCKAREQLQRLLPHAPTSPYAYEPTDVALGLIGGILSGADKLSRVAYLRSDPALAEVLGIEAVASQSTFSRFLKSFDEPSSNGLNGLHQWAMGRLPSLRDGYTLDLDSWSLLHEDGHQEGVCQGYTPKGLEPCHRPLVACLAEPKLVAGFWLRPGNAQCPERLPEFVGQMLAGLPAQIRIGCVRADAGFYNQKVLQLLETRGLRYIIVMKLYRKWQAYCTHGDAAWTPTGLPGVEVQEVQGEVLGRRMLILAPTDQRTAARRGQGITDGARVPVPRPGHQFARQLECAGHLASLQRPGRDRKPDQRVRGSIRGQRLLLPKVLGDPGGRSVGHLGLQPVCTPATRTGFVGKSRAADFALALVLSCRGLEPGARSTHPETGRAGSARARLVAPNHGKTHLDAPTTHLQCSCLD
jgi:Transposase DDE domain group 1